MSQGTDLTGPITTRTRIRARLRRAAFRGTRPLLHRVLLPLLGRSGRLESAALRLFALVPTASGPKVDGLPCPVETDGLAIWYDTEKPSTAIRGLAAGTYERPVADLFEATLRPGMTAFDIGGHIGYFTLLAAKHVGPGGRVWSFEPDPANRAYLERNIGANHMADRIQVVPCAVGAGAGQTNLYRMTSDTGSSTLYPRANISGEPIAVPTVSLDEWASTVDWPAVDLMKIDTEGAEGTISSGMAEIVKRNPKVVIIMELHAEAMEAAGTKTAELLSRLRAMGLENLELLDDRGWHPLGLHPDCTALVRRSRWAPLTLIARAYPSIAA